jgi:small subunit ribosomal protein S20
MANHFSALKRNRIAERRTAVNRARKSRLRNQIRKMRRALQGGDAANAQTVLSQTFAIIDRSAKTGVIKKNTAARYKSRLNGRLKTLTGSKAA